MPYIYIWHSPVPGNIFYSDFPFFRLSITALNFCGNGISSKFKKPVFIHIMTTFKTPKLSPETFSMGAYRTPKVGCFFKIVKIHHICCFITQLTKRLHQWSLYEVIEDILPFVLNTKRPLSDIWLVSYKQNSFGCFLKKFKFRNFSKTPKTILLIFQQPNIAQRPFCIQNEQYDIFYHLI